MIKPVGAFFLASSLLLGCGDDDDDDAPAVDGGADPIDGAASIDASPPPPDAGAGACVPEALSLARDEVGRGFGRMTDIKSPPGDARIFVVEKDGVISIVDGDDDVLEEPFLDIRDRVDTVSERGLLGIAFHPAYSQNRRFFLFYTQNDGTITLAEGTASEADPDRADDELDELFTNPHSAGNHNGGWLDFGPDGYLYAAIGDNASGDNAPDTGTVFGKILRLDVSVPGTYTSPETNPFADGGGRPEIWAYGLRNPWRASFDRQTGDLYIADVGEGDYEEVNAQPADSAGGLDYGWNTMEGSHCRFGECDQDGLTLPVHDYSHNGSQASITGGYVYRGAAIPACSGTYFFADYVTGDVGSFRWPGSGAATDVVTEWSALSEAGSGISTFGVDRDGELLIGDEGVLWRVVLGAP